MSSVYGVSGDLTCLTRKAERYRTVWLSKPVALGSRVAILENPEGDLALYMLYAAKDSSPEIADSCFHRCPPSELESLPEHWASRYRTFILNTGLENKIPRKLRERIRVYVSAGSL